MNWIKTKITSAWQFTKRNVKRLAIWTGFLGVASAAVIAGLPVTDIVPSLDFNGQTISFPYTDDNVGEDLIIRTDRETYGGWDSATIYFSVTNISGSDELVDAQLLFGENEQLIKISELKENAPYQIDVNDYEERNITCKSDWVAINEGSYSANKCGERMVTSCDSVAGKICTVNKYYLGSHKEIRFKDTWDDIPLSLSKKFDYKIITSSKYKGSKKVVYSIPNNQTRFFRANVTFQPQTRSEFFIEARGLNGAKGILDPWFDSNFSTCRKLTFTAGAGGFATTTTNGYVALATTTLSAATTSSGKIEKLDANNDLPFDVIYTDGTDCNSDAGSLLKFHHESYASTTGDITSWLRLTDVSSTTAKNALVYYGNASATDQSDEAGVYDTTYQGVWNLKEDPSGTAPQMLDSTSNNNDGTSAGTMTTADQVDGQIDGSLDFDGSDDYVSLGSVADLNSNTETVCMWANRTGAGGPNNWHILWNSHDNGNYGLLIIFEPEATDFRMFTYNASGRDSLQYNMSDTTGWHNYCATYNGTTTTGELYLDGALVGTNTSMTKALTTPTDVKISNNSANPFDGEISDVRVQNIVLHAMDILTNYNMGVDNTSFLTFGAEETETAAGGAAFQEFFMWFN